MLLTNQLKIINRVSARAFSAKEMPQFTKDRYPVKRGNYNAINDHDISHFESILEKHRVLTGSDTEMYNIDWIKSVRGASNVVLKPKTTEEVSEIVKYCHAQKLAVVPQGGNTGLVGGSVPVFDEVVISMGLMNKIEHIDEYSGIVRCQSGVVLEKLEAAVNEKGLIVPLDLGSKGTCQIGGNVSTNAGGLRLIRYGNLHGSVLGVEAVLANGKILNLMSNFKKDNTGYHLKHLFIGSEGSLGVVTKLSLHCPTKPNAVNLAFVGLENFQQVLNAFLLAKKELGEILSSVEMIDEPSLEASTTMCNLQSPIQKYPFYMLFETSGSNDEHDKEKLNNFLKNAMEKSIIVDGVATNEPSKMRNIWDTRERIAESLLKMGYCFKYDLSLPLSNFYDIVGAVRERVGNHAKLVSGYGHIGDSNMHLNIVCEKFSQEVYKLVEPFVFEYTSKLKGSVSAEHGIGFHKPKYLHFSKSPESIQLMKEIKNLMDPENILNPYKVLPLS